MLFTPTNEIARSTFFAGGAPMRVLESRAARRTWPWLLVLVAAFAPLPHAQAQVAWGPSKQFETHGLNPSIAVSENGSAAVEVEDAGEAGAGTSCASHAGQMFFRIFDIVGNSDAKVRQNGNCLRTLYDDGRNPRVGVSRATVVEVHNGGAAAAGSVKLWYRIGDIDGAKINWRSIPKKNGDDCSGGQSCQYDVGINPSVAFSGTTVVEVHNAAIPATGGSTALWYRIGDIEGGTITWRSLPQRNQDDCSGGQSCQYDTGFSPSVALVPNPGGGLTVVEVHNGVKPAVGGSAQLWYRIGNIDGGTITWQEISRCPTGHLSCQYDNGFNPTISSAGGTILETHNATFAAPGNSSQLWYDVGETSPTRTFIGWTGGIDFPPDELGFNPTVASFVPNGNIFDSVTAITVHDATVAVGNLWYRVGPVAARMLAKTLTPSSISQSNIWADYNPNFGSICAEGTGGGVPTGDNEAVAGFHDLYPIADTNCRYEEIDRSLVQFDLSAFDQFYGAGLSFNERTENAGGTGHGQPCTDITLGMATGNNPAWGFDNGVALPDSCSTTAFNVNGQVQQWITGSHANFGFIFAGPRMALPNDNSNLPTDNDFNNTFYGNLKLTVIYNRLLNPRVSP
jgi:hypothetical protein